MSKKLDPKEGPKPWEKQFDDDRDDSGNLSRVATRQKGKWNKILTRALFVLLALVVIVPVTYNAIASNSGENDTPKTLTSSAKKDSASTLKKKKTKKSTSKKSTSKSTSSAETSTSASSQSSTPEGEQNAAPAPETPATAPETPTTPPAETTPPAADDGYYTVQAGDNPFRIATNHGLSLQEFRALNGFTEGTTIHPGMRVRVK